MSFNPKKSVSIRFGRKPTVILPKLCNGNDKTECKTHVNLLGNCLQYNLTEELDVAKKKGDLFGRVNALLVALPDAPEHLLLRVFDTKCCHFYGVQSWDLSDKHTNHFFTAWNRCARRLLELHPATHTRYVTAMVGWNSQSRIMCSTRRLIQGVCSHPEP